MKLLIFLNTLEFFENFLTFLKISFRTKFQDHNRETVGSITQNILKCNTKSCQKTISKIRDVSFIFQNFKNKIQKRK